MMNKDQENRYERQLALNGIGATGQQKLLEAAVLVIGAGGLGCPALQYLAAAGVGRIGIADGDRISLSNLQRQVLYTTESIGRQKSTEAANRLSALNPEVTFEVYDHFVEQANAVEMISRYDLVIAATDNFASVYLVNDACVLSGKPLIYGAVSGFEGQLAVFNTGPEKSNYRDLFPEMPAAGEVNNCEERGVLGVLPGIIGTMQAAEALKIITGTGQPLTNKLLTFNLLRNEWLELEVLPAKDRAGVPASLDEFRLKNYGELPSCTADYINIGPAEFDEFIKNGDALLIDVRENGEFPLITTFNHLAIPLSALRDRAKEVHGRSVVLFCHSGVRSITAAAYFPADNLIYNLKGGIMKWLNSKIATVNP